MSQYRVTPEAPGIAAGAIPIYSRVKVTGKDALGGFTIAVAGLNERTDGIALQTASAVGDECAFLWLHNVSTVKVIAGEAFAFGAELYTEANGKYQDTAAATSYPELKALEAATADGDIVEAMPLHYAGAAAS